MGKPAGAQAKLTPHQSRSRLVLRGWAADAVNGWESDTAGGAAVIEQYRMDQIVSRLAELYATLAGGPA